MGNPQLPVIMIMSDVDDRWRDEMCALNGIKRNQFNVISINNKLKKKICLSKSSNFMSKVTTENHKSHSMLLIVDNNLESRKTIKLCLVTHWANH